TRHSLEIKNVRHREVWEFPVVALREAIINAFVHADYAQRGSSLRLAVFRDRIEVENPGNLPPGLTIEDILRGVARAGVRGNRQRLSCHLSTAADHQAQAG